MTSVLNTIDSAHDDMIHDAAFDYYGNKLATCSSDKTIKIFNVQSGHHQLLAELRGHDGPVWQVSWAHPRFGNVLASCSYDRNVIIWKEENNKWQKSYEYKQHESSVNSVAWAPQEFGLIFACASSDGAVSVVTNTGGDAWNATKIPAAHRIGCNAVSWAPHFAGTTIDASGAERSEPQQRIVTGGCDNLVKIWRLSDQGWEEEQKLEGHSDWVRDVAWAPSLIVPRNIIASCSQDRLVIIWTNDEALGGASWEMKTLNMFDDVVWHLSWSVTSNILAVSTADNKVTLWKENVKGDWVNISDTAST